MPAPSGTPAASRAIKRAVWPRLREVGFTVFTGRSAWRDRGRTIDVVNFQAAVSSTGFRLFLGNGEATYGTFSVRCPRVVQGDAIFEEYRALCFRRLHAHRDGFFEDEDIFVGAALIVGRRDLAIQLYEAIVALDVPEEDRRRHAKEEARRERRKPRPGLNLSPSPFWHDEAQTRLARLREVEAGHDREVGLSH